MAWLFFLTAALFLVVVPGLALLSWFFREEELDPLERFCLATGLGLALQPITFYALFLLHLRGLETATFLLPTLALLSLILRFFLFPSQNSTTSKHWRASLTRERLPLFLVALTTVALVASRFLAMREMTVPAWGDSVHHTYIVQLFLDNHGLFSSWAPLAPLSTFSYHFGFHSFAASFARLTGVSAPQAVLISGQILGVFAVLSLYPLALRLTHNTWAALATIITAGFLSRIPGYFLNWGVYPKLMGFALLPTVIYLIDSYWKGERKGGPLFLTFLLLLSLPLSQMRASFISVAAVAAWSLWGLWERRREAVEGVRRLFLLGCTGVIALVAALPWIHIMNSGNTVVRILKKSGARRGISLVQSDLSLWSRIDFYYAPLLVAAALLCLLLALGLKRRFAFPFSLWIALSFLITNPGLIGLSRFTGWIFNEVLIFCLYVPLSLLIGWGAGELLRLSASHRLGRIAATASLAAVLLWGFPKQAGIADPFFQLVTKEDLRTFRWIRKKTPQGARFLVNGFLAYNDKTVAGSDAGWWLPYFTGREGTVLPCLYMNERLANGLKRPYYVRLVKDVQSTGGEPSALRTVLTNYRISHLFLGQKRAAVGYGSNELIHEEWLRGNPDFKLLFSSGKAQAWSFSPK